VVSYYVFKSIYTFLDALILKLIKYLITFLIE